MWLITHTKKREMPSLRQLEVKVQKLEEKIQLLQKKNSLALSETRKHKAVISELRESRARLRTKYKVLQSSVKGGVLNSVGKKGGSGVGKIKKHKFTLKTVILSVSIYLSGNCSFRGVVNILKCLNVSLNLELTEPPSKSSVENWVQKLGLHLYREPDKERYKNGYAVIIDESMVIGQERLMAALVIPAEKSGEGALKFEEVEVVWLEVRSSWRGEDVQKVLEEIEKKMGSKAAYVISDGGVNLKKGIRLFEGLRIFDVGHHTAGIVERQYKGLEQFVAFNTALSMVKFKEVMKATSYLLPPKERAIARFMNLSQRIDWGMTMLKVLPTLKAEERNVFGFLEAHKDVILELDAVFEKVNGILKLIKINGLSYETINRSIEMCQSGDVLQTKAFTNVKLEIEKYLNEEKKKLPNEKTIWHSSSDIIESIFGVYKDRKASSPMHGVTPIVLILALIPKMNAEKGEVNVDVKKALETVTMDDLKEWNRTNLIENQVVKRRKIFKK